MKIIINAFQYSAAITGTDRMAYNFLTELQKLDTHNSYYIVCSQEDYNRSAIMQDNFKIIKPFSFRYGSLTQRAYNKLWRILLPWRLKSINADCYFSFHNMSLPRVRVARKMHVFNLDLIPIVLAGYESIHKKERADLLNEYKATAKKADHIFSISAFSKAELVQLLDVKDSKVDVIHLAADPSFKSPNSVPKIVNDSYIFTLGGSEPRKNVTTVIESYQQLSPSLKKQFKLVIAGGKWHGEKLEYEHDENVIELGYVPDEDLPSLYANASVFVFASVYEGFGFTILEAMASGAPVINAQGSSLDEVAGNATLSFNPENKEELTKQLTKVLEDKALRQKLVEKGYDQERKFSWEESALKLHSILIND